MRILMTSDCVGGVWTYALELARELSGRDHEVVLAVMGREVSDQQRDELDAAELRAWDARPYRLEWMAEPEDDLAAAGAWLRELSDRHRPDVVHLNQFNFATLPWTAPTIVVAHSDVVTWWRAVHGCDPPATWDSYRERVRAGLTAAGAVIAPTQAMLTALRSAYGVPMQASVVHNARRLPPPARDKQPLVAAAGRFDDPGKNAAAVVRAGASLPWPVAVAGVGPPDTPGVVGRLGAREFTALLADASLYVEPARYEPFGLAALEAGLLGCALVLGDIPSLREVWENAALFVDPDDDRAIHAALQSLIDDPQRLRDRQDAALRRAATFDAGQMAAAYLDVYERVQSASTSSQRVGQ